MTRDEYDDWWIATGYREDLPEPIATLTAHIMALHERIDRLPMHDGCREYDHQCACAYDFPAAICGVHMAAEASPATTTPTPYTTTTAAPCGETGETQ